MLINEKTILDLFVDDINDEGGGIKTPKFKVIEEAFSSLINIIHEKYDVKTNKDVLVIINEYLSSYIKENEIKNQEQKEEDLVRNNQTMFESTEELNKNKLILEKSSKFISEDLV